VQPPVVNASFFGGSDDDDDDKTDIDKLTSEEQKV